jgi:hypothetical protein
MGQIICLKCGAKTIAETFEQADDQIDHSKGILAGKPCNGNPLDITWDASFETDEDGNVLKSNPLPVASVIFHFGPGSKNYKASEKKSEAEVVESENDSLDVEDAETSDIEYPPKKNQNKNKNQKRN